VLRKAAAAHGDPSVRRIVATTGLPRSVIHRSLAGTNEPSLATLMCLRRAYGVPVEDLIREVNEAQATAPS